MLLTLGSLNTSLYQSKYFVKWYLPDFSTMTNLYIVVYLKEMMNQVIQGDCLELMQNIADKSVDMILCDLPYGTTACKWDTIIPFEPLWEQYKRIIKDNGAIVLTASQPFTTAIAAENTKRNWICIEQLEEYCEIGRKRIEENRKRLAQ